MQAVILLGGKGTRIQSLYSDRPKALIPVCGKPILQWQLDLLIQQGVTDFVLAAGYMADKLCEWLAEVGEQLDNESFFYSSNDRRAQVTVAVEPEPLGTGGAFKFVTPLIRGPLFFGFNGDSLLPNLNLLDMFHHHIQRWSDESIPTIGNISVADFQALEKLNIGATLAVTPIKHAGRYGTVEIDDQQHITSFKEKTEHTEGVINGGVYLLNKAMLRDIPVGEKISMEEKLFPLWAENKQLYAFQCSPPLMDMGTPDGLNAMESFLGR